MLAPAATQTDFAGLCHSLRPGLQAYCYRMLGSLHDAEDAVQETLLKAWRGLDGYAGRAPLKTWLYQVATNACLDLLRARRRRILPMAQGPAARNGGESPRIAEDVPWLEPYPDDLLEDPAPDPDSSYRQRESVSLAFLAALQHLPPRQRAALILRDVLGWSAAAAAQTIGGSVASLNSALQRARQSLRKRFPTGEPDSPGHAEDPATIELLHRYVRAWEDADVPGLVALLKQDVVVTMPPDLLWFDHRDTFGAFLSHTIMAGDARGKLRLYPARANRQPAFALYRRDGGSARPLSLMTLTIARGRVATITGFMDPRIFPYFGMHARAWA